MRDSIPRTPTVSYTDIDENATGATTVLDPTADTVVTGVYADNGGSSAIMLLEVTDGTNTATITPDQSGGDGVAFHDRLELPNSQSLAINVTTAEGSGLSETAAVIHSDL